MVYKLKKMSEVSHLFEGWHETMIYSCLQGVMWYIYVTDTENPKSAAASAGCFIFYAGEPDRKLLEDKPEGFVIMVPQNEAWAMLIEKCFPDARRVTRYAIKKDTEFNREALQRNIKELPTGYELARIDARLYDKCLANPFSVDFVSAFGSKDNFLKLGRGMVILKDEEIVAGAASYTRYNEGIEIEVDTMESERRKHLATIACSALILQCLEENLYPSWDAQNMNSVCLAQKLGYEFDHEYAAYEVDSET